MREKVLAKLLETSKGDGGSESISTEVRAARERHARERFTEDGQHEPEETSFLSFR